MKKWIIILLSLLMALFVSCYLDEQYGSLTVGVDFPKTIEPDATAITCASYKAIGSHDTDSSKTFENTFTGSSTTVGDLLVGTWTVYVEGYNADGVLIATSPTGSVTVQAAQTTSSSYSLAYLDEGEGTLTLSVKVSETDTTLGKVVFTVGDSTFTVTEASAPVDGYKSYTYSGTFDVGQYAVTAEMQTSAGVQIGLKYRDTAHVYANLTSSKTWTNMATVVAPTITPDGGVFANGSTSVTMATTTSGATIYYTTDGTTPTTTSTKYTDSISVSKNTTIKAIAWKAGMNPSAVVSKDFHVKAATPDTSISAGTYDAATSTNLYCSTSGSTIYYTTDGTTPTTDSSVYSDSVSIAKNTTLKAIAVNSEYDNSDVMTNEYKIKTATPSADITTGSYQLAQTVTLSCATADATIYYTTDGSDPATNGTAYTSSLTISSTTTLKIVAKADDFEYSDATSYTYTIKPKLDAPVFSPNGGQDDANITVSITALKDASIYYTTDGSAPTTSSNLYSVALTISSTCTVKAIAVKEEFEDSDVASATFTIDGQGTFSVTAPKHYNVSINKPSTWTDDAILVSGIYAVLTASVSPSPSDATYSWYVDDVLVGSTSSLKLGVFGDGYVNLLEGLHSIYLEVSISGKIYSSYMVVSVSSNGTTGSSCTTVGGTGPAGGIVFYDKGFYSDGWRYLEAAPSDITVGSTTAFVFGFCRTSPIASNRYVNGSSYVEGTSSATDGNSTGTAIGTGKANTTKLVSKMGSSAYTSSSGSDTTADYAAKLCDDYTYGGYSDWFLPSIDELNLIYMNLKANDLGGFSSDYYWSSSERSNHVDNAWFQYFDVGNQTGSGRGGFLGVRSVRAF